MSYRPWIDNLPRSTASLEWEQMEYENGLVQQRIDQRKHNGEIGGAQIPDNELHRYQPGYVEPQPVERAVSRTCNHTHRTPFEKVNGECWWCGCRLAKVPFNQC